MEQWIIQENLIKSELLEAFVSSFDRLHIPYQKVNMIPFSTDLPDFEPSDCMVFYGATSLMMAVENSEFSTHLFYDSIRFSTEYYSEIWQNAMLNSDVKILDINRLSTMSTELNSNEEWFIRPNEDDKSFSGMVKTSGELLDWATDIVANPNVLLSGATKIALSGKKEILKEWRNYIVDGSIVESTRYLMDGMLSVSSEDVPEAMQDFIQEQIVKYAPNDVFVMDVAETSNGYKIIECNCFNGTGFYLYQNEEVFKVVQAIQTYFTKVKNKETNELNG